jgi:excisionase family DNA binding protein
MRKQKAKATTKRAAKALARAPAGTAAKPAPKKQHAPPAGEVLDLKSAADFLKVSKPTFYRWLAQGKIKGHKAGNQWRFYRADLENFLHAEEPSALQVDSDALRQAVQQARKARNLPPPEWPEAETPEESTVIGTINMLIRDAIDARASDIHIDNNSDETLIRYRIDGVLTEAMTLPKPASRPLVSRLKLMGDMNISERRIPQHGRITVGYRDLDFDVRVTTMPAMFGESAMCRILDQSSILIGLDKLGLSTPMQEDFERILRRNTGMVIVTGPSGSGRTTTLYSALNLLNSRRIKIVTIEDPVEYRLRDTMQVHVNRKAGLTFPVALRMFMHADPDLILASSRSASSPSSSAPPSSACSPSASCDASAPTARPNTSPTGMYSGASRRRPASTSPAPPSSTARAARSAARRAIADAPPSSSCWTSTTSCESSSPGPPRRTSCAPLPSKPA